MYKHLLGVFWHNFIADKKLEDKKGMGLQSEPTATSPPSQCLCAVRHQGAEKSTGRVP